MKYLSVLLGCIFLLSSCSEGASEGVCGDCSDGVACTVDTCNEDTEQCEHQADDSRCAQGETCDPQEGCQPGEICSNDAECDNRQYCDGVEKCVDGTCAPGTAVDCTDINECTDDDCDEYMNVCINLPNDENCAADERCDRIRGCVSTVCQTDIDCDDSNICTTDTCVNSICQYEATPGSCSDGLWCTENDECVDGECAGTHRDCGTAAEPCNVMTCDEPSESCVEEQRQEGEPCDDGLYCTLNDICSAGRVCVGTTRDCSEATGQCADGVCDDDEDACVGDPKNEGQPCNDADLCTVDDRCWHGECFADPRDCDDGNPCTNDSCNPQTGDCINDLDPTCRPTGDPCDQHDQCVGGLCLGLAEGFGGGYCSEDCAISGTCVGTGVACADYQGDVRCFVLCDLGQGDICLRVGYQCAPVGLGTQGVCWPGEDNCNNNADDDGDGLADCNDEDCATDPNCIVECTAASGTASCGSQKTGNTGSANNKYEFYFACTRHRYDGPEHIYSLVAQANGSLNADLDTGGAFDGALIVLAENCWPELSCVAHDERAGVAPESVQVPMRAGETYYIVIEGYSTSDSGSYTLSIGCGAAEDCDDTVDNDGDGKTDCYDVDCAGDPACMSAEVACADDVDNDEDGDTDCDDSDCWGEDVCTGESNCRDKIDNDLDGDTDCQDLDCIDDSWCDAETICDDQYDNDDDLDTDCWDSDCTSDAYCQVEADCRDGIDNDADWDTDCDDTDCAGDAWCNPESNCIDNIDNDNDGDTDCDDEDCQSHPDCAEHCTTDETLTQCDQSRQGTTTGNSNNVNFYLCEDTTLYEGPEYVYAFTPSTSGRIQFQVTSGGWDSALFVMEDECTPSLPCVDYHDTPAGDTETVDVMNAVAGTTYYAIIEGITTDDNGDFNFSMVCDGPEVCDDGFDNDFDEFPDCADLDCEFDPVCTPICTHDDTIDCFDNVFHETHDTNRITKYECVSDSFFPGGERIYKFTPGSDVYVEFTIMGNVGDFALFALEDSCAPSVTCIDWADEDLGIGFDQEMVNIDAIAGTDYYIIVDSSTTGGFQLGYWLTVDCQ